MAGGGGVIVSAAVAGGGDSSPTVFLDLVREITRISANGSGIFKKDCTDLVRRVALLTHLLEEIKEAKCDFRSSNLLTIGGSCSSSSNSSADWWSDLLTALQASKQLLIDATSSFDFSDSSDGDANKISTQFQSVTWKLAKALGNISYDKFDISEEVQEQVELVRAQLTRAAERYVSLNSKNIFHETFHPLNKDVCNENHEVAGNLESTPDVMMSNGQKADEMINILENRSSVSSEICQSKDSVSEEQGTLASKSTDETKKSEMLIPDDFRCPISLELMRDPVIVATGQTYERSYIQRWIDCGNATCPKTQQKLGNLTLTPNYVLRSLIAQWCTRHNIDQPTGSANGRIKRSDGSFREITGDTSALQVLVRKLTSRSIEERRTAVAEIRSLSKRSTDNRILIANVGAIPILVNLLTSDDVITQENAVTSILNLSIYENNKGLIMLAGAIPSIVQLLRAGSMEARENAAATLFSLSLADENKIIIGASGAIPALVDLLQNGSTRGKKDAATALFNLCIYQGNKGRAIRAGIITALLKMLTDSRNCMVDEALTILSVLAGNQEAKASIVKARTIPVLIDLLRTGLPRNKENAASILLSLCKRDNENLGCISRLGAVIPLTELTRSGTQRAKRKAMSLLEHLRRITVTTTTPSSV